MVPRETAAISARSVYIIQPCTMPRHFMQNHIHEVYACLAVTCHLHFWQNDRDLLRATAGTRQNVFPKAIKCSLVSAIIAVSSDTLVYLQCEYMCVCVRA